jgi:glyoxylase-like metal-dependent hydrolase (beta-lactamase superfamily II)
VHPIALHAGNPGPMTGAGNWTWLIPGRVPTLIDAGTGEARHLDALEVALDGASLAQVLVTHAHSDHAAGVVAIAERIPSVRFRKMPWPERDLTWPVRWEALRDGDEVDAGDFTLSVVHTPGHAPDHVCFGHAPTRAVFGGDLAIEGATVWIPASLGGDLADYLSSLERMLAWNTSRIYPAHGPIIQDPGSLLRRYLAHRRERDEQIVDALRRGDTSVSAIVARIYPELAEELVPRALETVVAHLRKLESEGAVRRAGDAWHIMGP